MAEDLNPIDALEEKLNKDAESIIRNFYKVAKHSVKDLKILLKN